MLSVTNSYLRQWRPSSVCTEETPGDSDQQRKQRKLYPGALLTRAARADFREFAADVLDQADATAGARLEALLSLSFCRWSKLVAERHVKRPFAGWLRDHLDSGEAYQIADDPEVERALRLAFGLQMSRRPN